MKRFELFMCCMGNGITVCNKAVQEYGDYKVIAHIANCGKIKWYVDPAKYVPGPALLKIEHAANVQHETWVNWLHSMPQRKQYEKMVDTVPLNICLYVSNLDNMTDKLAYLEKYCYEYMTM